MASDSKHGNSGGSSGGATATSALSAAGDNLLLTAAAPHSHQSRRSSAASSEIVLSLDDVFAFEDLDDTDSSRRFAALPAMLDCYSQHVHDEITPVAQRYEPRGRAGTRGGAPGFFSLQTYGALRKGGPAALFSSHYGGYALSAALSGYFYVALSLVVMRFPPQSLGLAPATFAGLRDLLSLQWSVVLLLGLLSDSYAPFGLRRNAYVIGGWALVATCCCALFALLQFGDALSASARSTGVVVSVTGAMLFLVVLTNATDIRIVELSQQEELLTRGQLVGTYQIVRIAAQVAAHSLVKLGLAVDASKPYDVQLHVGPLGARLLALHLAVLALVPIPFLVHHAFEPRVRAQQQFVETCRQFLRSAQQKAIWQLVAFNCVLYFFSFLENRDVARALAIWVAQPPSDRLLQAPLSDLTFVAVLVAWRSCGGVNTHWRKATAFVIASWTLAYCVGNSLVALDVVRAQAWFPVLLSMLKAAFRVLLLFSAFIPTIEVAQVGSEGTIYGLLSSFQSVVKILGAELSAAVVGGSSSLAIRLEDVERDAGDVGATVFHWVLATAGVKLLALLALFFCPRQKLDAQQRRIYGGYSKLALGAFLVLYAVSFPYASYTQYAQLRM